VRRKSLVFGERTGTRPHRKDLETAKAANGEFFKEGRGGETTIKNPEPMQVVKKGNAKRPGQEEPEEPRPREKLLTKGKQGDNAPQHPGATESLEYITKMDASGLRSRIVEARRFYSGCNTRAMGQLDHWG